MLKYLIPLAIFIVLGVFLAIGLKLNPTEIPSPFIGKPAPAFSAPRLDSPEQQLAPADLQGKVWLFNVWASWCTSCRAEHPVLNELAKQQAAPIIGLNYKDAREDALSWLNRLGNPYEMSVVDPEGRIGIDYGVYGVPETFVIDKKGVIRHKLTGPVTPETVQQTLLPLIAKLQAE
ncbi:MULTISPECIES: DsbE family thiol:disulfide interchange protein [Methylomicrobium]|uniref:Periplasmic protein thiol:disulfide oxidoreductase, DsbE subfamily n=1 Tax=Methylomicrobium album BG8 TaxID=686340 RepID=H8GH55_METAL|nr:MULTISPECIES: DsbE family thiol:disulfide interchange protein [Methylomicrobium]EIC28846.1 periplasmic protein thiol:disulfide oxidoreductase, DsbE subfamily [Methylomicrobium album BG8]